LAKKKVETKLCTSVHAETVAGLAKKGAKAFSLGSDLVELRIDALTKATSQRELEAELSVFAERAIFTVRSSREGGGFRGTEARRLELISRLAELRPAYLDIELATAKDNGKWVGSLPKEVERIVSWHDFHGTPSLQALRSVRKEERGYGSLAKVVTTATKADDNLTTLTLCADEPERTISFCMGELGTVSRVLSMRLGAPLAYASIPNEAVAPGQLPVSTMRRLRDLVA
jgi:3-dehydroquinate dehydratase type I